MSQNEYLVKVKEGWILLAYSKKGLCSLNFPVKRKPVILSRKPPLFIVKLEKELKNYFSGKKQKFSCLLDLEGFTKFQVKVWKAAKKIPYGKTCSYSEIAKKIGSPGSARAVGNALGKNPCPIVIPCHRVVKNDGSLGGFSGGRDWKRKLLELEAAK
ncbi:MAG: hypothetical protein A2044_08505 [Candidatus Firestonebacteria bacterium GWA2_43_8]|nr:MAG: hypothetical protein A2044_08505 [Candidatus Firestonebacteria bacterium GWA2_43_8]